MNPKLEAMRTQLEMISLESDTPEGTLSALERMNDLVNNVSAFVSNKLTLDIFNNDFVNRDEVERISKSKNYLDYANVEVFKVPGQCVTSIKLTHTLKNIHNEFITSFVNVTLPAVSRYFASIANNLEELNKNYQETLLSPKLLATYEEVLKALSICFDANDTTTTAMYKELYERNADFQEVFNVTNELIRSNKLIDTKVITNHVNSIDLSLKKLYKDIEQKNKDDKLSGTTKASINKLSAMCFNFAQMIEFYSVYIYKVREHVTAVKDTSMKLNSLK